MELCYDATSVARDLMLLQEDCSKRKLIDGTKWASEMLNCIPEEGVDVDAFQESSSSSWTSDASPSMSWKERNVCRFASSLMDCQEFMRASKWTANYTHPLISFLHYYSRYLAGEKNRLDTSADISEKATPVLNEEIESLHQDMTYCEEEMDHFHKYLFALVLEEMNLHSRAVRVLVEVLQMCEYFWPAWFQLSKVIRSKDEMLRLRLPDHWMKDLFLAEIRIKFQMIEEAMEIYDTFRQPDSPLRLSPYVLSRMAHGSHLLQDLEKASQLFGELQEYDSCRLEHLDDYSNTLFVLESRVKLASLTHHCYRVNKFCPETCCVVGNYYGLRGEHDKAVMYFQRAVKLNRKYSSAWTLMGHEFMELKNTPAAAIAYRHALDVDPHDHRAWFGLGNIYEILNMPNYATFYYNQAHKSKPMDSRFLVVLGDMFRRQKNYTDASKCYWRAHSVGDMDGHAMFKLGSIMEEAVSVDAEEKGEERQRKEEAGDASLGVVNLSKAASASSPPDASRVLPSFKTPSVPGAPSTSDKPRSIFGIPNTTPQGLGPPNVASVRFLTPPTGSTGLPETKDADKESDRIDKETRAARCYWAYLKGLQSRGERDEDGEAKCYKFLSDFSLKQGNWDAAIAYSQCCMQYDTTKAAGKHNIQQAAQKRAGEEGGGAKRDESTDGDSMMIEDSESDTSAMI